MIKAMNKRQINYFSIQQNKFMKTTNSEGGMRESFKGQKTILQEHEQQASCWTCHKKNLDVTVDEDHSTHRVLPNNNQDMWLKYLILNLNQIDEL